MMTAIRPHLVIITTSFPTSNDGREAAGGFVVALCRALARLIRLTVVAPGAGGVEFTEFAVRRFTVPRLPLSLLRAKHPRDWPAIMATLRAGQRCLDEVVAEGGIGHLFCLWALPSGYWGARTAARCGIPYSVWTLGSDIWQLGHIPLVRSVLARVLRGAEHCFADGEQLCRDTAALGGRQCGFLPSSRRLEVGACSPPRAVPPYRLAFLGRWHPNKGPDLLLGALAQLGEADWQRIEAVRVAGGGPMQAEIQASTACLLDAGHPIRLEGFKDPAQAAELLCWADLLLIPSRIESIPVVFSDALQCGRPVVATPVGDLPELIRRLGVGEVAEAVTPDAFAHALSAALAQGSALFLPRIAEAARQFDVDATAQRLAALLFPGVSPESP